MSMLAAVTALLAGDPQQLIDARDRVERAEMKVAMDEGLDAVELMEHQMKVQEAIKGALIFREGYVANDDVRTMISRRLKPRVQLVRWCGRQARRRNRGLSRGGCAMVQPPSTPFSPLVRRVRCCMYAQS